MVWINLNDLIYETNDIKIKKGDLIKLKNIEYNIGYDRCIFPAHIITDKHIIVRYPNWCDRYKDQIRGYIKRKFLITRIYKVLDHEKNCFCTHKIYDKKWMNITDGCLKLNKLQSQNLTAFQIENKYNIKNGDFILVKTNKSINGIIYKVNNIHDNYPLIDIEHEEITENGYIKYTKTKIFINKFKKIKKEMNYHKVMDLSYIIKKNDKLIDCKNMEKIYESNINQDITQLFNPISISGNNERHFKYIVNKHIKDNTFNVSIIIK
jgi:hypothetical protein